MPRNADGTISRARFTSLKLNELSSVDNPAQPGALALIMKRDDSPKAPGASWLAKAVAKYVGSDDGAHTFSEVLRENKFSEAIWPMADAFTQSVRSILGDSDISASDRDTKITASVDQFLAAVRELDPPEAGAETEAQKVEKQLAELISKGNHDMPKSIEELTAKVSELTGQLASANTLAQTEKARADTAEAALETEKSAHGETKKALVEATDETLKVGEVEIKKSEVGAPSFAIHKAQEDRAVMATLEKRAATEFRHVPGTETEKALVLKHAESLPEDAKKAFDTIMSSAEKMAAAGFGRLGENGGQTSTAKAAQATFDSKVAEIAKRDNIPEFEAMRKARTEFPAEFEAANEGAPAN